MWLRSQTFDERQSTQTAGGKAFSDDDDERQVSEGP